MLRISKNIKKIALSLLVVGLAISTQAFKKSHKAVNGSRFDKVYYHVGDQYLVAPPIGTSCEEDTQPCRITFLPENQPNNDNPISENALSGLTYTPSTEQGSYQ